MAGFCALCAMQKHVRTARQATGRILAPKDLVSNLRCKRSTPCFACTIVCQFFGLMRILKFALIGVSRNFRNCRQEDAHEYMINLLECMHKCSLPSGVQSESSDAYRTSLVHKIFGGSLRSQVNLLCFQEVLHLLEYLLYLCVEELCGLTLIFLIQVQCEQCLHCSNKVDPFLDLSLDISKADSLQRALLRFTAAEHLDDGGKVYQCEKCKQKVRARKQLTVHKAPYVLTVHLKRFEAHRSEKIDRKVQFTSAIDMKPFVSGPYVSGFPFVLYFYLL